MQKYSQIVIHFGEIWLRGRNRNSFIGRLYANVKSALSSESYTRLANRGDRFMLYLDESSNIKAINDKLAHVFGVSWFAPAVITKNTIGDIIKTANMIAEKNATVKIVPHRTAKEVKFTSYEITSAFLKRHRRLAFKLDREAKKRLYINVTKDGTLIYLKRYKGLGGLPVGSSGKAIVLLSGGIDSPVASFYAMKRGLEPVYLHVHAFPGNDDPALSKINELVKLLSRYNGASKTYYVPGYLFQSAVIRVPKRYELVLFKRFIYKVAERIAKKENAECVVSGESLGQVASQTVRNMSASERNIKQFLMRPLIGFDKQEIVNEAKRLGTFDLSIKQYKDVCSINARNTVTGSNYETIARFYKKAGIGSVITRTIQKAQSVEISS